MRTHHVLIAGAVALAATIVLLIGWAVGRSDGSSASPSAERATEGGDLSFAVEEAASAVVMLSAGRAGLPMGSGFVISPDGALVTSVHVVRNLPAVSVVFGDGASYRAERIGLDRDADIALFRIDEPIPQAYPALKFANSDLVRPGQPVVLMGAPFGLGGTATSGIVSAASRKLDANAAYGLIQTDAALTAGSSGGPLLNTQGEVIGMASARLTKGDTGSGVAFAVPANTIKAALERIRAAAPASARP